MKVQLILYGLAHQYLELCKPPLLKAEMHFNAMFIVYGLEKKVKAGAMETNRLEPSWALRRPEGKELQCEKTGIHKLLT